MEAFILKLYRKDNKEGFIKAFSDQAESFTVGFSRLEKTCRFQNTVSSSLEIAGREDELIEIRQPMTQKMNLIQLAIFDILNSVVSEFRSTDVGRDLDELETTDSLFKSFDVLVSRRMDLISAGSKAKQLFGDIRSLRSLLQKLFSYDCIEFAEHVDGLILGQGLGREASWGNVDSVDTLVKTSRARVFEKDKLVLEENAKWKLLRNVIKEVSPNSRILILVHDDETSAQLAHVLSVGSKEYLQEKSKSYFKHSSELQKFKTGYQSSAPLRGRKRMRDTSSPPELLVHLTASKEEIDLATSSSPSGLAIQTFLVDDVPKISIHSHHQLKDPTVLADANPDVVIIYDAALVAVRSVEVFRARQNPNVKIYFLIYKDSGEEQRYLYSVRKEKEAFERLIKAKATLALDIGLGEDDTEAAYQERKSIIVDMREFRSSLPFALHKGEFELHPHTIEIGDYVLSPDICVERKSIPDLISSFSSGRLYYQIEAMTRAYKRPYLLIEYDAVRGLSQASEPLRPEISITDVSSKLVLLLTHFPTLEIIWSQSTEATCDLFRDLKKDEDNPRLEQIKELESKSHPLEGLDPFLKDLLLKIPGVTVENHQRLARKFKNLRELLDADLDALVELMGPLNAQKLHEFVLRRI